jgi:glycolate oxidase FAD binding subunit
MPTTTVTPSSLGELRNAVLDHPGSLAVQGAGTAADWAGALEPPDTTVCTTALSGIVTHNPGDMTVAVRAGTPLRALQDQLAQHGQRVAFDAARAGRGATVGGLFATADAGPLALAFGSLRDLVIGATVVLPDGTLARTGGHVIKNVAGYDLTKLLHGAYGTLGFAAELVLRLHPRPAATATVAMACPRDEMTARARAVAGTPVEASAVEWAGERLLVSLEGTENGVEARVRRLLETLGGDAEQLSESDAAAAWDAHAAAVADRPEDGAVLRIGVLPSELRGVLGALDTAGGLRAVTASPLTGVATVTLPVDAVAGAHDLVARSGGTTVLRQRSTRELPAFGPAPSSAALLRAVAAKFDPGNRFGRGRFAPWLPTGVNA